ncbi:MAG: 2-succinyl-5-enolpyruvyl-6-hydroxy-3-cyclohexene-1-carboxylic-acid synthase [Acidimicrobiia bacterium]
MNPNVTASFALIKTLKMLGVEQCVISPGSRSTPIAYAAINELESTVIIDERDAGFTALGIAESSNKPCIVITTSGSAPAHLFPSVVEAYYSNVAVIVISADRPEGARGKGQAQTINQVDMFGSHVRLSIDAPSPNMQNDNMFWALLANDLYRSSLKGPVHLNIGFNEPLVPDGDENIGEINLENQKYTDDTDQISDGLLDLISKSEKIIATVGRKNQCSSNSFEKLMGTLNIPVLADVTSNIRNSSKVITNYDFIMRTSHKDLQPDLVLQFSDPLTSKKFNKHIENTDVVSIKNFDDGFSPFSNVIENINSVNFDDTIEDLIADVKPKDAGYIKKWNKYSSSISESNIETFGEVKIYEELSAFIDNYDKNLNLLLASSMPIRYSEWFLNSIPENVNVFSHRGTNGIDGMVSSSLGISIGSKKDVLCVVGDVALTHNIGFLGSCNEIAKRNSSKIVFALVDNDGGAIFSHLDQADNTSLKNNYSDLYITKPNINYESLCSALGINYFEFENDKNFKHIEEYLNGNINGVCIVKFKVDHYSGRKCMIKINELLADIH